MDPAQLIKTQMGELIWNNAVLVSKVQELEDKIKDLDKPKDKK